MMPLHNVKFRPALLAESSYGTTLLTICLDTWDTECLQWSPPTLCQEINETFGIQIPELNFDKLMAAIHIVTSDEFFKHLPTFIKIANALSGSGFHPAEFDPADSAECAWACTEALLLQPPDDGDPEPFSEEIRHYIGHVLKDEGYVTAPDILKIAAGADFRDQVRYNFADDPELFAGIYQTQQGKTQEIETMLRDGLRELVLQLQALPLRRGSTQSLAKLAKSFQESPHARSLIAEHAADGSGFPGLR